MNEDKNRAGENNKFIEFLIHFLDSDIIEKTKKLLIYHKDTNTKGLPNFVAYSLAENAPEIMFMLLYRLYHKQDIITSDLKPKMLGMITLFYWLGKGEKQRDHSKLLGNIWLCVKKFDTELFWSKETVQRAMLMDDDYEILTKFPPLKILKKIIPKTRNKNIASLTWEKIYNGDYGKFIDKLFYNKDLILYSQRSSMFNWFNEFEEFNLEDTNRAFDWDHICPNSYIKRSRKAPIALKNWYISNGNYRAWPYSLNRGDQDVSPSEKLNPEINNSDLKWWSKNLKQDFSTQEQLKEALLKLSVCDEEWLGLNEEIKYNIKDTAKDIIQCIFNRNYNICKKWYDELSIDKLIPDKQRNIKSFFENIINLKMWGKPIKEGDDRRAYYMSIGGRNLYLYFSYNIDEFNILKENNIYFGIYEEETSVTVKKIKSIKDDEEYDDNHFYSFFTLIAFNDNSIKTLLEDFHLWLMKLSFPDKKTKGLIINKFNDSIKIKYKSGLLGPKKK